MSLKVKLWTRKQDSSVLKTSMTRTTANDYNRRPWCWWPYVGAPNQANATLLNRYLSHVDDVVTAAAIVIVVVFATVIGVVIIALTINICCRCWFQEDSNHPAGKCGLYFICWPTVTHCCLLSIWELNSTFSYTNALWLLSTFHYNSFTGLNK